MNYRRNRYGDKGVERPVKFHTKGKRLDSQTETAEAAETVLTGMWIERKKQMGWGVDHLPPWAEHVWDGLVELEDKKSS